MLIYSGTNYLRLMSIAYVLPQYVLFECCSVFAVKARIKNNFDESRQAKWDFFRCLIISGNFSSWPFSGKVGSRRRICHRVTALSGNQRRGRRTSYQKVGHVQLLYIEKYFTQYVFAVVFFRRFFGNSKQIIAEILS